MPRGYQMLARAVVGITALSLVALCSDSSTPTAEPATTATTAAPAITTVGTSASTDTSVPVTTSAPTTSVVGATMTSTPVMTTTLAPDIDPNCPTTPHAAVVDRDHQRAWLCDQGVALPEFVITTARTLPDPGTFAVYDKDMHASSTFGGHYSTMTHFVAFTRGENTGARIGFHTVPVLRNGDYAQPLDSVGSEDRRGDTSGCIRVLPEQGQVVWDWLAIGDEVRVVN